MGKDKRALVAAVQKEIQREKRSLVEQSSIFTQNQEEIKGETDMIQHRNKEG